MLGGGGGGGGGVLEVFGDGQGCSVKDGTLHHSCSTLTSPSNLTSHSSTLDRNLDFRGHGQTGNYDCRNSLYGDYWIDFGDLTIGAEPFYGQEAIASQWLASSYLQIF